MYLFCDQWRSQEPVQFAGSGLMAAAAKGCRAARNAQALRTPAKSRGVRSLSAEQARQAYNRQAGQSRPRKGAQKWEQASFPGQHLPGAEHNGARLFYPSSKYERKSFVFSSRNNVCIAAIKKIKKSPVSFSFLVLSSPSVAETQPDVMILSEAHPGDLISQK